MKTSLLQGAALAVVATLFTGCFATVGGPDGGVIAAGSGPRGGGVVVDPPGPLGLALGGGSSRRYWDSDPVYVERRRYYAEPEPVVYVPRSRRVIYREEPNYSWNRNPYRHNRGPVWIR
jgi:hypothetical protein